jgi:glycosyltransferase involved in cell wall biosynthesis
VAAGPDRRLRVCHVLHTLAAGGAQELLVHLARAAPTAQLELSVLSLTPSGEHPVAEQLAALGVPVLDVPVTHRNDPRAVPRAVEALRHLAPDVLHSHGKQGDVVAACASLCLGTPQVSTLHLIEQPTEARGRVLSRTARVVRSAVTARTVAVSAAQHSWYTAPMGRVARERVVVVHNGVPPAAQSNPLLRRQIRSSFGIRDGELMILALGLMRPDRGHPVLVRAARSLPPEATVVLAGDGPLRAELERLAGAGDGARVVFAGFRPDVPALLAAADVVAHPSTTDALPTALLHALAAGRPVVASDVGGIPEIVSSDVGRLVPVGDVAALAAALRDLGQDPVQRQRMGQAARCRHQLHFSSRAWAASLREVYEQSLQHRPARRLRGQLGTGPQPQPQPDQAQMPYSSGTTGH